MRSIQPVDLKSGSLSISHIELIPVLAQLPTVFQGSHYRMTERATVVTRVHTTDGLVGEAYAGDEAESLAAIMGIVEHEIAPRIVGMNALATSALWEAAFPCTFDILRDRRLGLVALAGVDAAIWDVVGKALGVPLHLLWGGAQESVPMIAIGGYYGEPLGSIRDEMTFYRDKLGLAGVKFKIGGANPREDAERVGTARAAAGDEFVIAVDANQGYTVQEAVEFCDRTQDLNIRWFEEPVRWANDAVDMARVRSRSHIPICAGQSEYSPSGCRQLMEQSAIDVCNFDASWSGGPTAWLRAAAIAHGYSVEMAHHEEPQVSTHLIGSQPHGTYAECFHPDRDPFWWNMISNRPELVDGRLPLPDGPGFGWTLNTDYIDEHRVTP